MKDDVWKRLEERGLSAKVDRERVERVIKEKTGIAEDITLDPKVERFVRKKEFLQKVIDFFSPARKKTNSSRVQGSMRGGIFVQNPASSFSLVAAPV